MRSTVASLVVLLLAGSVSAGMLGDEDMEDLSGLGTGGNYQPGGMDPYYVWRTDTWAPLADNGPSLPGVQCATPGVPGWGDLKIVQAIPAPANGTALTLDFDYKAQGSFMARAYGGSTGDMWGLWAGGGSPGTQIGASYVPAVQNTGGQWASDQYNFTVDADYDYLLIMFRTHGGGDVPGDSAVDNAVLTPEPATMTLLSLGGLALLRRRR